MTISARISWSLSPHDLFDQGATSSLWRVTQVVLAALIEAIVPPITLTMLGQRSPQLHKRLANPRRMRRQAVNYPRRRLSWCLWGETPHLDGAAGVATVGSRDDRKRTGTWRGRSRLRSRWTRWSPSTSTAIPASL